MISGDDPRTVGAITRDLGMEGADEPVDARTLPEDRQELGAELERHAVFGRVTPQQKRAMVLALQAHGHTVAMTGDGVNDALALKDADIGVAMGSGSDATRAVAQLVLLDSTFDALPSVVAEGRRVLGNIERTSGLYLNKTVYAMLISLAIGVAGFAFPFLPRHLTLVGAITIGIPSFFLALAPNTDRFRPGFVNRVLRFAIPTGTLAAAATFLAYTVARNESGVTLMQAQTTAVMVLTWIGLLVLSILAAPLTRDRLILIWSMAGLFLLVLNLPATRAFFALEIPPLIVWLAGFGIAGLTWSFARLFVPGDRPVGWRGRERDEAGRGGALAARQWSNPTLDGGQMMTSAFPITLSMGMKPRPKRESSEFPRLSPITKRLPSGTGVLGKSSVCCVRYGSSSFCPFTYTLPPLAQTVSPGTPITRLMKSSFSGFWTPSPSNIQWKNPPIGPRSGCAFGLGSENTTMSPRRGSWK